MKYTRKAIKQAIASYEKQGSTEFWTNKRSIEIAVAYAEMKEKLSERCLTQKQPSSKDIIDDLHFILNNKDSQIEEGNQKE